MIGTSILKELRRPLPIIHRKSVFSCCKAEFAFSPSGFSFMSIHNSQDSSLSGSEERGGGGGWSYRNSKYQNTDDFFRKDRFTVRFFAKYQYRNTISYFTVSLPRLARSTPTESYLNK